MAALNPMGGKLRMTGWLELGRLDTAPSLKRLEHIESNVDPGCGSILS